MVIKNRDEVLKSARSVLNAFEVNIENSSSLVHLKTDIEKQDICLEFIDDSLNKEMKIISESVKDSVLSKYEVEFFHYFNRLLISEINKIPLMKNFYMGKGLNMNFKNLFSGKGKFFSCKDSDGNSLPLNDDIVNIMMQNERFANFFRNQEWCGIYFKLFETIYIYTPKREDFVDENLSKKIKERDKDGKFWLNEIKECEKKLMI